MIQKPLFMAQIVMTEYDKYVIMHLENKEHLTTLTNCAKSFTFEKLSRGVLYVINQSYED